MTATEIRTPDGAPANHLVQNALRSAVEELPDAVREIAGYHLGWLDERGRPTSAPAGKALRPALVLAGAAAVAGPGDPLPGAVAVELVHNFSLLHDDVMDGDRTRRHRPAAWTIFGTGPAILAGDALLSVALDVLGTHRQAARTLAAAVQELIEGQLLDLDFERRHTVTIAAGTAMARGKTAALIGCSVALGALLAGAPCERVDRLDAAGRDLGLAFQLVDDLLGIWGDPAVTGKPVGADLARRKLSLPVVAALNSGTTDGAALAALYTLDRELSPVELVTAAALVEASGARQWCRDRITELTDRARRQIVASSDGDPAPLLALATRIGERES